MFTLFVFITIFYSSQAEYKAKKIYAKENEVDYYDLESTITGKV